MGALELFHVLRESECDLTVLKMKIRGFDGPVIATVDRIVGKSEVILKPYTLNGARLTKTIVKVEDIEKIVKIHLHYSHFLLPAVRPVQQPMLKKPVRRRAA